jgi:hypothetical protein
MKEVLFSTILILLLLSCESKVEIPNKHIGVIISNEEATDRILRPGKHSVKANSRVIVYDIGVEHLEIQFDFLFKDVSRGDLKLVIEYVPMADSLPSFYKIYRSHQIPPVIDSKSRSKVRELLGNYNTKDLTIDELKSKVITTLSNDPEITNYVKVRKVDIVDFRW